MATVAIARAALDTVGLGHRELSYLAEGLSSDAWLIEEPGTRLVLRVSKSVGRLDELVREHAVLGALTAVGAYVPAPVAGSWEHAGWSGPSFSIITFIAGEPLAPKEVMAIAGDIAGFLDVLHATIPPQEMPNLAERFAGAPIWPIHRTNLSGHPVAADPRTAARLDNVAGDVRRVLSGLQVLVHSDLHEGNIVRTDTGAAFLDFGCAFMGVALWDYAALAFFLGWSITERVLVTGALHRCDDVRLVALSFALYRWESSSQDPEEAQHCAAFIEETLDLARGN
jgi:Ser/Thr protein kinase RdoA (MazF antagonist)